MPPSRPEDSDEANRGEQLAAADDGAAQPRSSGPIAEAFAAFDDAGVRAALLRDEVEGAEGGDDIDVLVEPSGLVDAERALASLGFVQIPAWGHGHHRFHLRFSRHTGWTKIDLVDRLAFGPSQSLRTELESSVLARRVRHGEAWKLHPSDDAWALVLHVAFDAPGAAPAHRAAELGSMATRLDDASPLGTFVTQLGGARLRGRLIQAARSGDADRLRAAADPLARAWRRRGGARHRYAVLHGIAARQAARFLVPLRRPGITVALLGADGSGKSTAAGELQDRLPLAVRPVYMGMYARQVPNVRGLGFAVRLLRLWRGALAARWHATRGRIVIFDRYSYDALLPTPPGTSRRGRLRRWLLARAVPSPDVTLLLDAPAEQLRERKAEQTLEELDRQRADYLQLRERVRGLIVVDARRPLGDVADDVAEQVWRRIRRRLARRPR